MVKVIVSMMIDAPNVEGAVRVVEGIMVQANQRGANKWFGIPDALQNMYIVKVVKMKDKPK